MLHAIERSINRGARPFNYEAIIESRWRLWRTLSSWSGLERRIDNWAFCPILLEESLLLGHSFSLLYKGLLDWLVCWEIFSLIVFNGEIGLSPSQRHSRRLKAAPPHPRPPLCGPISSGPAREILLDHHSPFSPATVGPPQKLSQTWHTLEVLYYSGSRRCLTPRCTSSNVACSLVIARHPWPSWTSRSRRG